MKFWCLLLISAVSSDAAADQAAALDALVDEIWTDHNKEGDDTLDLEEAKDFIGKYLEGSDIADQEFNDDTYQIVFDKMDKNPKDGAISKEEMKTYISDMIEADSS